MQRKDTFFDLVVVRMKKSFHQNLICAKNKVQLLRLF